SFQVALVAFATSIVSFQVALVAFATPIVSFQVTLVGFATPIVSSAVASVIVAGELHFMAQNSHQKAANLQQFSCL
ncbi:MAG: hypothetical protein ACYT04_94445, partial [Nostoc sp.]